MSLAKVTADVQMKLFGTIPSQYDKCQRLSLVELRVKTERPQRTCTSWAKAQEEIVSRIKGVLSRIGDRVFELDWHIFARTARLQ